MTHAPTTDPSAPAWRLLIDPPADGAWNMAVDEALLERYAAATGLMAPTLRLYGWDPPALSLGKSQPAESVCRPELLHAEGIDLVRRPTGGRAVLHERERTYAVVGRLGPEPFPGGVVETYRRVAGALVLVLRELGLERLSEDDDTRPPPAGNTGPSCFDAISVHEISQDGRKLVGSSQLRRRGAFLQHGSFPLSSDPARLARAFGRAASDHHGDLELALGAAIDPAALDQALAAGFERAFRTRLVEGELSPDEAERAARLRCWKYDSVAWTIGGRLGARECRWGPLA